MTNADRITKFKEIARLINARPINKNVVDEFFVEGAYNWKKETYGKKHADNLLDKQIEFLNRIEME